MNKGSYGIATFYLSLIESSEQLHGLPAHYQLAGELKQIGTNLYAIVIKDGTTSLVVLWMVKDPTVPEHL